MGQISRTGSRRSSSPPGFPSPRGVGADLTGERRITADEFISSFRPLAGLGQISQGYTFAVEEFGKFPSPRGVGADLTMGMVIVPLRSLEVSVPSRGWGRSHAQGGEGMMVPKEFPSPRGVGADLTVREGKHAVDGRVSVPSRGWGRSHTTCRSRFPARASSGFRPLAGLGQISQGVPHRVADDGRPGFRPLAGLGQISHYIRQYKHFADEFPSPRGVGADLTLKASTRRGMANICFRPLAGLGQISHVLV